MYCLTFQPNILNEFDIVTSSFNFTMQNAENVKMRWPFTWNGAIKIESAFSIILLLIKRSK